jgi:hypothetical protein
VDFDQPHTRNNLADVSQAVIDELWPGYVHGERLDAEIEYTGVFADVMRAQQFPEGDYEELSSAKRTEFHMWTLAIAVIILHKMY